MERIALARIPAITFYDGAETLARRGRPIPQLTCVGKACQLYRPEVVRCTNLGGQGTDVDWKCEADLPEALRFGRVEVSCEGWSAPGDPYVLKGSCGLEYRLVQVPSSLNEPAFPSRISHYFSAITRDPAATAFMVLWTAVLLFILYSLLRSCLRRAPSSATPASRPGTGGPFGGWFSGSQNDSTPYPPPPPYSKSPPTSREGWRPGFWTGAALGGLGTYLFNNNSRRRPAYDWENERIRRTSAQPYGPSFSSGQRFASDDRGEGSSNLGSMRRSTGLGGSKVR